MRSRRASVLSAALAVALISSVGGRATAGVARHGPIVTFDFASHAPHGVGGSVRTGYLPIHPDSLTRAKERASDEVAGASPLAPHPTAAAGLGWSGQSDPSVTPPDSTGAIGPTRYVQLVNLRFGIYDRSGSSLSQGTLGDFTGIDNTCLSDPQVIWDVEGQRFYYLAVDVCADRYAFGFSKASSPSVAGATDWCRYVAFDYGSSLPDYPKLGDSSDYILIGANIFALGIFYEGSDVSWIAKSPLVVGAGGTCPDPGTFKGGVFSGLKNADGSDASTPVPANGIDPATTGYVVAGPDAASSPGGIADYLTLFGVTAGSGGDASISGPVTVSLASTAGSYAVPASAPERKARKTLDTMDARLTQAVAAVDPSNGGGTFVWTQHTVFGGAGAEVRYYEINATTGAVARWGRVSSSKLFVFNAAVSPDRAVPSRGGGSFGESMAITFNTSSSTSFPAIQMASRIAGSNLSPWTLVQQSPGKNVDFSCKPVCRWGDYAGASPDPAADPAAAHGVVWLTDQWNVASVTTSDVDWRTSVWSATP
jgi:hypothetical protein